jgi:hypothetical protein
MVRIALVLARSWAGAKMPVAIGGAFGCITAAHIGAATAAVLLRHARQQIKRNSCPCTSMLGSQRTAPRVCTGRALDATVRRALDATVRLTQQSPTKAESRCLGRALCAITVVAIVRIRPSSLRALRCGRLAIGGPFCVSDRNWSMALEESCILLQYNSTCVLMCAYCILLVAPAAALPVLVDRTRARQRVHKGGVSDGFTDAGTNFW